MRHPLNVLPRIGRGEPERHALLGDLEEAYRADIRPRRSVIGAQAWYAREVLAALACTRRESLNVPLAPRGGAGDVRCSP